MNKERGILFNQDMVRALLDGRKTQTRRPFKNQPEHLNGMWRWRTGKHSFMRIPEPPSENCLATSPLGKVGDLLYCRETFAIHPRFNTTLYRADGEEFEDAPGYGIWKPTWKPSIHMPKWAARIWLEITDVRVERVQSINAVDISAEGVIFVHGETVRPKFARLWEQCYPGSWERNDWCWAYTFKRITK